jgi:hypothetical protein
MVSPSDSYFTLKSSQHPLPQDSHNLISHRLILSKDIYVPQIPSSELLEFYLIKETVSLLEMKTP